jgi:hypothetical protein
MGVGSVRLLWLWSTALGQRYVDAGLLVYGEDSKLLVAR